MSREQVTAMLQRFERGEKGALPSLVPESFVRQVILYVGDAQGLMREYEGAGYPNDTPETHEERKDWLETVIKEHLSRMAEKYPAEWIIWMLSYAGVPPQIARVKHPSMAPVPQLQHRPSPGMSGSPIRSHEGSGLAGSQSQSQGRLF